jgi:hypothetical protein
MWSATSTPRPTVWDRLQRAPRQKLEILADNGLDGI